MTSFSQLFPHSSQPPFPHHPRQPPTQYHCLSPSAWQWKKTFSHRNSHCNPDRLWEGLTPSLAGHKSCTITGMLCYIYNSFLSYTYFFLLLTFPIPAWACPSLTTTGKFGVVNWKTKKGLLISYFFPGIVFEIVYFCLVVIIPFLDADGRIKRSNKNC